MFVDLYYQEHWPTTHLTVEGHEAGPEFHKVDLHPIAH